MKKICISFIIFIILLSSAVLAETLNYEIENKKREEATREALTVLLEKYKTEEVSEEERIIEYTWNGYGVKPVEDDTKEFKCEIGFNVKPYLNENSIWDASRQICFAEFDRIDGELILRDISLTPENYDEFMVAFEEYEKNKETVVETTGTLPEESMNFESKNEIEKLSNWICVISALILSVSVLIILVLKVKKK